MRKVVFAVMLLVVAAYLNPAFALKFIGYGDTRDNATMQSTINDLMDKETPEAILFTGDMENSYSSTGYNSWKSRLMSRSNIAAVINAGNFAWAIGNHESGAANSEGGFNLIKSSGLVKGSATSYYAWKQENCFFVCLGYLRSDQYPWLRTQLTSESAKSAKWRFIFSHKPVYSTSEHGADGDTSEGQPVTRLRKYCDTFKVTAYFSGHDHGYQRTKLLNNNATVATSSPYDIRKTPGTIFMVNGGGGAPLRPWESASWAAYTAEIYNYTAIKATEDTCYFTTRNDNGAIVDQWIVVDKDPVEAVKNTSLKAIPAISTLTYTAQNVNYSIQNNSNVSLKMYNARGELVSTLVNGHTSAGSYSVPTGKLVAGIYIAELKVDGKSISQKITVN